MRKLAILVSFVVVAAGLMTFGPEAKASGCNGDALVNEAIASTTVDGSAVSIRLWEDLTCPAAGEGFNGPADQGHLSISADGVQVCAVDGIDMGNDPFGFGSSVKMDATASACGANVSWSGFPGVYGPNTTGPGIIKAATATGTVWWGASSGAVNDASASMSKRAQLV